MSFIKLSRYCPSEIRKILVVACAGLGDAILFTPALYVLRRSFPNAEIFMLAKPSVKELMCGHPFIAEVINYENRDGFIPHALIKRLDHEQFDLAFFSFPPHRILLKPESRINHFFRVSFPLEHFIKAKFNVGHKFSPAYHKAQGFPGDANVVTQKKHTIESNLDLLRLMGIQVEESDKKLFIPVGLQYKQYAEQYLEDHGLSKDDLIIGFHQGCNQYLGHIHRRWPEERFAKLGDKLVNRFGAKIIIFGGPHELESGQRISSMMKRKCFNVVGQASLKQTAALISVCNLFISTDSGLMHLATAMGIPVIGIFAFCDPAVTGPYGSSHVTVRKEFPCSPCYSSGEGFTPLSCCRNNDSRNSWNFKCIKSITVDDVLQHVGEKL